MLELVAQVLVYSLVGLVVLGAGFLVLDLLTPGHLAKLVVGGNRNAALLSASGLLSLGLIQYFAIYFTGAGWDGIDDALVFGAVGVLTQAIGFVALGSLLRGVHRSSFEEPTLQPWAWVLAAVHVAFALVVCASLT